MVDAVGPSLRTEDAAEAGTLKVVMGGQPYRLPCLTIEQSEEWQEAVGDVLSNLDLGLDDDSRRTMKQVIKTGGQAELSAVAAYDITGVLGGSDNMRKRMTARELHAAMEVIADAEYPFDEEAKRSVVEMFGLPLRAMGLVSRAVTDDASRRVKFLSSLSPDGASATPTSDENGRASNSSSGGRTARSGSRKKARTG